MVVHSTYVSTSGAGSTGIIAENLGLTPLDTVKVYSGTVITRGDSSDGIVARGDYSTYVHSTNYVKTFGNFSEGIVAYSRHGPTAVVSNAVFTYGNFSDGIFATDVGGGNVTVSSGQVITTGDYSTGIFAFRGGNGTVGVTSSYVKTSGYESYGIVARSTAGNVTVSSGTVKTTGNYSSGIYAYALDGTAAVTSTAVRTSGYHSTGIYVFGTKGATVQSTNYVRTYGAYADGIHAIANAGAAYVSSNFVYTKGNSSVGIYAYGNTGATVKSSTVITENYFADGIEAISTAGKAYVLSNSVHTVGGNAPGINAYGYTGATVKNTDLVKTEQYYSDGIKAYAEKGDVLVNSAIVFTYGFESRGISAVTYHGNVSVTAGITKTYGYSADAIAAVVDNGGNIVVHSNFVYTEGDFSQGIHAHDHATGGGGNVSVYSGDVITAGYNAHAVYADADAGNVYVKTTGDTFTYGGRAYGVFARSEGTGNTKVVNTGAIISYGGFGVYARSVNGTSTVDNHGAVFGFYSGIFSESGAGTLINNYVGASISGGGGEALFIEGAPAVVNNAGYIYGYAVMLSNHNVVNNSGTWFAYGNSYFGTGSDVFNNTGLVKVNPFSGTAQTTVWSGLTAFNNSGLVDLRNGHVGDVFTLSGNGGVGTVWTGSGASTLGVDANLGASLASDRMNIGAANGSTALVVTDLTPSATGVLNFTGTVVVAGTSGSASNFTWVGKQKGFVDYELRFFAGPVTWNIVGLPDKAAFEMLKAPEMAQDFWRRTGDAWTAREQEVRDSMWGSTPGTRGEGWEMWAQAQVGGESLNRTETFTVSGFTFTPNLVSTKSDWRGFQDGRGQLDLEELAVGLHRRLPRAGLGVHRPQLVRHHRLERGGLHRLHLGPLLHERPVEGRLVRREGQPADRAVLRDLLGQHLGCEGRSGLPVRIAASLLRADGGPGLDLYPPRQRQLPGAVHLVQLRQCDEPQRFDRRPDRRAVGSDPAVRGPLCGPGVRRQEQHDHDHRDLPDQLYDHPGPQAWVLRAGRVRLHHHLLEGPGRVPEG